MLEEGETSSTKRFLGAMPQRGGVRFIYHGWRIVGEARDGAADISGR